MNKLSILFIAIIAILVLIVLLKPEPLPNGGSNIPSPEPEDTTQEIPQDLQEHIDSKSDLIRVTSPEPFEAISSPVQVTGEARGYWFFEASFPIVVVDWDGLIIGQGYATAQDEWMTEEFVPFTGEITFDLAPETPYKRGAIIFQKDNPSGLPENDDALEIPVTFE